MPLYISKLYFIQRKGTLYREKAHPAEIIKWIKVLQSMPFQPSKYQNNIPEQCRTVSDGYPYIFSGSG